MASRQEAIQELLSVKPNEWKKELAGQAKLLPDTWRPDMPERLLAEREKVATNSQP